MKIEYREHPIEEVFRYFLDGYPDKDKIANWESNYDSHTNQVIFKIFIKEK